MRRRLAIATVVVAAFAAWGATAASAGDRAPLRSPNSSATTVGFAARTEASFTEIPVRVRGALVVQFHGDQSTGCAARGLCGFSGTIIWQPPSTGTVQADTFSFPGRTDYEVALQFSGGPLPGSANGGAVTTATVRFAPNGSAGSSSVCTDAAGTGNDIEMPVNLRAASITLAAASPSLLGTRCGGPLQSDIASLLPRRIIDVATLSHGRAAVSLASSADFAVRGLAGTVTSTVQLSLGRPHTDHESGPGSQSKLPKFRTVAVTYRADLVGSVLTHIHGDPSSCAPLGSCGANGTFALQVRSRPATLVIGAVTRPSRPVRDALTALGLRKDGTPRGVLVLGFFDERGQPGYTVDLAQDGATCRDTGPGEPGSVTLSAGRGRLFAEFDASQLAPHLRCPGPTVSQTVAGTVRIGSIARHGGTIHFRTGTNVVDDGYLGRTVANLALTLSRPKVKITTNALRSGAPG
jgi:hypothetical protein